MKKAFFVLFLGTVASTVAGQRVDTVSIYSTAMKKELKCVVIKPEISDTPGRIGPLPVVYLLHGYSGAYNNWVKKVPDLLRLATELKLIIVCPDGGYSSWYFDSPVDPSSKYETFIAKEVPAYIDQHYPTIANRKGRAITGLSMGGHGGIFLAWKNAKDFGACGSMSGGVDLSNLKNKFDVGKRVGDTVSHPDTWKKYSVIHMIETKPSDSLGIIFDCGTSDFFYQNNKDLHEKMLRLRIPHDYIERPGGHDWKYWGNAVKYQLYYFRQHFDAVR